jgi:hypothetical protein
MSEFWQSMWAIYGTTLAPSTAYHPQSDGQSERTNRIIEQMLRHHVNERQDDWDQHLLPAQFAYNNAVQDSTQYSPFYLNYGVHPRTPGNLLAPPLSSNPSVQEFVGQMAMDISKAKRFLNEAQLRQKRYADLKRQEDHFQVGDLVLLSTKNLQKQTAGVAPKLQPKFVGPYEIIKALGNSAYKLQLPREFGKVHDVFHASLLKPYQDGSDQFPLRAGGGLRTQGQQGIGDPGVEFPGVVHMQDHYAAQPGGGQQIDELRSQALWNDHWKTGVDAQAAQMRDLFESPKQPFEGIVVEHQGIPATEDDLADLRVGGEVIEGWLEPPSARIVVTIGKVAAKTVAAVHGAAASRDQKRSTSILVQEARQGILSGFLQGVPGETRCCLIFCCDGEHLPQQRVVGIAPAHAGQVGFGYADREAWTLLQGCDQWVVAQAQAPKQFPGVSHGCGKQGTPVIAGEGAGKHVVLRFQAVQYRRIENWTRWGLMAGRRGCRKSRVREHCVRGLGGCRESHERGHFGSGLVREHPASY